MAPSKRGSSSQASGAAKRGRSEVPDKSVLRLLVKGSALEAESSSSTTSPPCSVSSSSGVPGPQTVVPGPRTPLGIAGPNTDEENDDFGKPPEQNCYEAELTKAEEQLKYELRAFERAEVKNDAEKISNSSKRAQQFQETLKKAIAEDRIDSRSALGQKMQRDIKGKDLEQWKNLGSDKARSQFRIEWAKRELAKLECGNIHERSWRSVDITRGK